MGLETCQILGQVSHSSLHRKNSLQTDMHGPGGDSEGPSASSYVADTSSRPDHLWPEIWSMSRNSKLKEKHNWAGEKPKFDIISRMFFVSFFHMFSHFSFFPFFLHLCFVHLLFLDLIFHFSDFVSISFLIFCCLYPLKIFFFGVQRLTSHRGSRQLQRAR